MSPKPPSLSRFRSAYSRQTALWILRACEKGRSRSGFFHATHDPEQSSEMPVDEAAGEVFRDLSPSACAKVVCPECGRACAIYDPGPRLAGTAHRGVSRRRGMENAG